MTGHDFQVQNDTYLKLAGWLDRLPHALLLHGPRGIGKLQLAERFAQFMLCEAAGSGTDPCGRCDACRWVVSGNHPDLRIVEPEILARRPSTEDEDEPDKGGKAKRKPSIEIRIEQMRELDDFVHIGSHRAARRVAIIHPAEDMNVHTANALLKNLEEPPAGAVFLLVSHRPARLLPTIRSRCVQVAVPMPQADVAAQWLEAQGVEDARAWLAFAGGAPLRALEFADGERGARTALWRKALESGDIDAIEPGGEREDMEALVDLLQKYALDRSLAAFGAPALYGVAAPGQRRSASAREWLAYAREMGRNRALARHPLNPRLFAAELLSLMPGGTR